MAERKAQGGQTPEENREGYLQVIGITEPNEKTGFRWTIKRKRFCVNLVRNGGLIGKAAIDAGYAHLEDGTRLLKIVQIRKYVESYLRAHLTAEEVTEESVIATWENWRAGDIFDYFEYDRRKGKVGNLKLKSRAKLSKAERHRVKKITIKATEHGQDVTLELEDRSKANDRLAQILGLLRTDDDRDRQSAEETARQIAELVQAMDIADGTSRDNADAPPRSEANAAVDAA